MRIRQLWTLVFAMAVFVSWVACSIAPDDSATSSKERPITGELCPEPAASHDYECNVLPQDDGWVIADIDEGVSWVTDGEFLYIYANFYYGGVQFDRLVDALNGSDRYSIEASVFLTAHTVEFQNHFGFGAYDGERYLVVQAQGVSLGNYGILSLYAESQRYDVQVDLYTLASYKLEVDRSQNSVMLYRDDEPLFNFGISYDEFPEYPGTMPEVFGFGGYNADSVWDSIKYEVCAPPSPVVEFDPDEARFEAEVRRILGKNQNEEILQSELESITEFRCDDGSNIDFEFVEGVVKVNAVSKKYPILLKSIDRLGDYTRVYLGNKSKGNYVEGMVYKHIFNPGTFITNNWGMERFIHGLFIRDTFIPGILVFAQNAPSWFPEDPVGFLPGMYLSGYGFIPGLAISPKFGGKQSSRFDRFIPGLIGQNIDEDGSVVTLFNPGLDLPEFENPWIIDAEDFLPGSVLNPDAFPPECWDPGMFEGIFDWVSDPYIWGMDIADWGNMGEWLDHCDEIHGSWVDWGMGIGGVVGTFATEGFPVGTATGAGVGWVVANLLWAGYTTGGAFCQWVSDMIYGMEGDSSCTGVGTACVEKAEEKHEENVQVSKDKEKDEDEDDDDTEETEVIDPCIANPLGCANATRDYGNNYGYFLSRVFENRVQTNRVIEDVTSALLVLGQELAYEIDEGGTIPGW